jgi:hypothetical protein
MPDETTTVIVTWDDLLNFGREYEHFTDLLRDRISDKEHLDQEEGELFVYDYGFLSVVDTGAVEVEVTFEYDSFEGVGADDDTYRLTPKGRLVLSLMKRLNMEYEVASQVASETFPDDGEVVGS